MGQAGIRLLPAGLWVTGGVITRDTAYLTPPSVFGAAFIPTSIGRQSGTIGEISGPLFWGFSIYATATHWSAAAPYTPQTQAHAEIQYFTQWLSRFPNGNFSFLVKPSFDFRSRALFPISGGSEVASTEKESSILIEMRILRGSLTFQRRNITGIIYQEVPGYYNPRPVNVYGVRWYFFD